VAFFVHYHNENHFIIKYKKANHHCTKLNYVQKQDFKIMAEKKIFSTKHFAAFSPYMATSSNSGQL